MTIWVGEQRHQLQPGGTAFLPRHLPHAVRYDMASRALVFSTLGGGCLPSSRLGPDPAPT
jgi:quercetin dioxygenase-like cupin family protein